MAEAVTSWSNNTSRIQRKRQKAIYQDQIAVGCGYCFKKYVVKELN
jgi:hypothetical protein